MVRGHRFTLEQYQTRLARSTPADELIALEELLFCIKWWKSANTAESICYSPIIIAHERLGILSLDLQQVLQAFKAFILGSNMDDWQT
tara:strand:- start:42 stop:305 length:264 start_codon:yes stop_codon:yes gene_type:complete